MNDIKIKFDNLMAGVECIQANSTAEIITIGIDKGKPHSNLILWG